MTNANLMENPVPAAAALFEAEVKGKGQLIYQMFVNLAPVDEADDGTPLETAKAAFSLGLMTEVPYEDSHEADGYGHARRWELQVRDTRFKLLAYQDGSSRTYFYATHPELDGRLLGWDSLI